MLTEAQHIPRSEAASTVVSLNIEKEACTSITRSVGGVANEQAASSVDTPAMANPNADVEKQDRVLSNTESIRTPQMGKAKMWFFVVLLCLAQFVDIFIAGSTITALPQLANDLDFEPSAEQWGVAGYTLTFASFQLIGGRLSDIYHPKPVFVLGFTIVGVFSILCAVSVHPIMFIVFRAVQGIGAAFTMPSSISLIVQIVTDPVQQSQGLASFGASGAVGNALGFVLGGVMTSKVGWEWVFYLVAIMVLPLAALSWLVLPNVHQHKDPNTRKQVDLLGVGIITAGLALFVYAISDSSNVGWGKPQIIVTLILSVIIIISFFFVEKKVPEPAVPPHIWHTPNIVPLFIYCLSAYWFLYGAELQLVEIFQDLYGWSALNAAVHCIPIGIAGGISSSLAGKYGPYLPRKILLLLGPVLMGAGSVLFAFADRPGRYWGMVLPGMILGMLGIGFGYVGGNIAIMSGAKKGEEGVVGALMNTAFQLGATIGLAILTSISQGVNNKLPSDADSLALFTGYADSFWCLVALNGVVIIMVLVLIL